MKALRTRFFATLFAASLFGISPAALADTQVFSSDFSGPLAAQINPGSATSVGVEGFGGLGPVGNQFADSFLRSATGNVVTLTLNGLQAHSAISIGFLFAAIDSLDGTGTFPSGDYFRVTLDGHDIFRESFANALTSQIQSYVPPAGVELARHANLGFGGPGSYYTDSAYNMAADASFANIAHTGATATFTFQIEGVGNQSLADESWAMDNLRVSVTPVPEPGTYALLLAGLGLMGTITLRRRRG